MPVTLRDPDLEFRLEKLAQRQSVPVSKHRMLRHLIEQATKDLRRPNAWREDAGDHEQADERRDAA